MTKDKEFGKKLRALMIPIALQNLMLAAVSAGDSAMLGFVDETAMSAVSLAGNIQFIENLFLYSVIVGGTIMTAQYWGKDDKHTVERVFGLMLRYAFAISVFFCGISLICPRFLMSLFTSDATLIAHGADYIRIAALSYLLTGISQCCFCVMKTTGQTTQSVTISTTALILDTVLNAIFIFWFKMGVKGVALTTTITRIAELIAIVLYAKNMAVKPSFRRITTLLNKDFLKCSVPIFINSMAWGIGTTLYSVIIGHLGTVITAAYAVANIVRQLSLSLCQGLGGGGEILLANVLGSGDMVKGKEYGSRLAKLSVICGFACAGLSLAFGFSLSHFMTLSNDVRRHLNVMILISAGYVITQCINTIIICCIFSSGGDTAFDAYSVAVTMWLIVLPAAAICGFVLDLDPMIVYLILSLDELVKMPMVYVHYKKYRWLRNITRAEI